jgi:crossover junction endodeoxyribonuclease RuvC
MVSYTEDPDSGSGPTTEMLIFAGDRSEDIRTAFHIEANVMGIDPDISGALALLSRDGELIDAADMPVLRDGPRGRTAVNAPLLAQRFPRWHAREVFCECVSAWPGEGPTGAFSFGRSRGVIEGACAALGLPIRFLTPPVWRRAVGLPPGRDRSKDAARSEAIRRWPSMAACLRRLSSILSCRSLPSRFPQEPAIL